MKFDMKKKVILGPILYLWLLKTEHTKRTIRTPGVNHGIWGDYLHMAWVQCIFRSVMSEISVKCDTFNQMFAQPNQSLVTIYKSNSKRKHIVINKMVTVLWHGTPDQLEEC